MILLDEMGTLLFQMDISTINVANLSKLLIYFTFNMAICLIVSRYLYYVTAKRKDYLFTFMGISTVAFLLCYMLESVKMELGFALGLFAIFSIIRYRTNPIPIKEMTYLFIVIGLSVLNSLTNNKVSFIELFITNFIVIAMVWGVEVLFLKKQDAVKYILYEKIEMIKPENYNLLIEDLKERTGLPIKRAEIGPINFLRDVVEITVYYTSDPKQHQSVAHNVEDKELLWKV